MEEGADSQPPWQKLQGQIFFGSPAFVSTFTDLIEANKANLEIPKQQRYLSRPQLIVLLSGFASRAERNARIVSGTHLRIQAEGDCRQPENTLYNSE